MKLRVLKQDSIRIFKYWVIALVGLWSSVILVFLGNSPDISVCEYVREEFGLRCEEHHVATNDGYTLFLKRIPQKGGAPVLLMPGLADSSATWLLSGRSSSLSGALYDEGYDVWLLDKRGRAPWRHDTFTPQDMEFWDFSFEESIDKDLPAMVEYVHRFTNKDIASIIGHSEGGMIALASVASHTQVADHVKSIVALGALVGSWGLGKVNLPYIPDFLVQTIHPGIFWGSIRVAVTGICETFPSVCVHCLCATVGCADTSSVDTETMAKVFSFYPRETSLKNLQHMAQCQSAKRLQRFDYGEEENFKRYGSKNPAPIDFSSLRTPTALFFGTSDRIVPPNSVNRTIDMFPKQAITHLNNSLPYGHADFLWSKTARDTLYTSIVKFVEKYA
mmetsp:Transcript_3868/g.5617  ORF Transcript_3868/g.5617 Transcript_3868/m.5617 type:complete len:390 (-) Transcript_3868:495-1664(-)|eukprot:CAMPEP_0203792436 /NCGR_PEP_ID=MMETSP0100_2-20121128/5251_1 /ASSEMBLY_ACC=CAM_ASM_000210 /TAXON_ID=96639 /ORGANISM=" , Strain NY0313808BC1" /LENGTH=389 /DNA_ID=CAMNT_0050695989 /DNA_START=350 /DNA_END=1519 /DNA_ORIENTATION=-